MLVLQSQLTRQEAIDKKLASLEVKFFGKSLSKFNIVKMRDVWVPYGLITYQFLIDRKTLFNRNGGLNREGELHFIFDYNEAHPFQYDPIDGGGLKFKKVDDKEAIGIILPESITGKEAKEKLEWHIQNRVLRRVYSTYGKIAFVKEKKFYRPAVEIEVDYGRDINLRYAYLDGYGVDSEHILGLKYRIG